MTLCGCAVQSAWADGLMRLQPSTNFHPVVVCDGDVGLERVLICLCVVVLACSTSIRSLNLAKSVWYIKDDGPALVNLLATNTTLTVCLQCDVY